MSLNVLLLLHFKRRNMLSNAFNLVRYLLTQIFGFYMSVLGVSKDSFDSLKQIKIIFIIHRQSNWRALITIHLFSNLQHIEIRVHESWCERKLRKIIRASQQCWKIHETWHKMFRMHMFIFRQNMKHYLYSFVEWYVRVIVIDIIRSCHFCWIIIYSGIRLMM